MAAKKGAKRAGARKRGRSRAEQSSEENGEGQVPPTRATGAESATGTAIRETERDDIPQGEDRGSKVPIKEEPAADYIGESPNIGQQEQPARFVSNGQIQEGVIASPTGVIPVSVVTTDPDEADRLLEQRQTDHDDFVTRRRDGRKLSERTLNGLSRAELKAIGLQRGYEMPDAGTRATREAFIRAQNDDSDREELDDQDENGTTEE